MRANLFSSEIKSDLNRRWVLQLDKEYENICFQYKIKLKKPLIAIEKLEKSWGLWDSAARSIVISYDLIVNHSWETVVNILKHEMAHQIVFDILKSNDLHGDDFLKSCDRIGLSKSFCKASISLDDKITHWKEDVPGQEEVSILRKIEKLLSLAQSANENEALLAMENVQNLYAKYHIKKISDEENQEYFSLILNFKKKKIPASHSLASYILQQHFFVKTIFSELYDPFLDEIHKTVEIFGNRQNVLMAEYVFHFLIERIELLWKHYQKAKKLTVKYKKSYQQGILEGFLKKLDAMNAVREINEPTDSKALIKQDDARLDQFIRTKYPRLSHRGSSSKVYSDHFEKGVQAGSSLNLNKPIHTSSREQRLLGC